MQSDYIKHHGIRGQKWGVRRFQNKDGTLTAVGRKRYDRESDANKSKGGDSNEEVNKTGLTDKQKRVLKTTAIASAVTIGAAATAYCIKKYGDKNFDKVLKSGTEMQHMSRIMNETLNKPFYASYLKSDNKIYAKNDFFGTNWQSKMTLVTDKDIKIAGKKTAEKTYKEWLNNDPSAKERFGKQSYVSFNKNLNSPDIRDKAQYSKYYDALKKKGYDAVHDINDQWNSKTNAPLIVFGSLKDIKVSEITPANNIKGSQTFNKAAQANDDLINELLNKNSKMLANF